MMYTYRAVAKHVRDGDTVEFDIDQGFRDWKHDTPIRLVGVWAPALNKPGGMEAKNFVEEWLDNFGRDGLIVVTVKDRQSFDRYLGEVWDTKSNSLNKAIVEAGHASRTKPVR